MVQLCRAVEQWEPRTETVAVHAWLHPWLPYLGSHMDQLYPTIRFKLSAALQQWHPSDQSALALLRPWHTVLFANPLYPLASLFISMPSSPLAYAPPSSSSSSDPLASSGPGTCLLAPTITPLLHVALFETWQH